jgi:hypothetical protein
MKTLAILALAAGAVSVTGCAPPGAGNTPLKPVARLDCPAHRGGLDRTGVSPDGQSCRYVSGDGSQVDLRLVKVSGGDPDAVLAGIETELQGALPPAAPEAGSAASGASATAAAAARVEAEAQADAGAAPASRRSTDDDHVDINLPGLHIKADGDKANVQVAGVHVNADDGSDNVHVTGGTGPFLPRGRFSVDANDRGAVIRARSAGPNVRATLIMASDEPSPQGWRAVGYQADGPRTGPLVVAVVRSKGDDHDEVFDAARRLAWRAARR